MINGVINVYKEAGFTSFDVVAKLRGIYHQKKIGHTGTLDPDAEGVLPVCLGKATKLCGMLTNETKTYEAVLLLGRDTDTQDTSGRTLQEKPVTCTEDEVQACVQSFEGEQLQVPPMYSALKVNGKKLYELAREGKTVEREARPVHFYEIRVLSVNLPRVTFRVTCSRGTYIRTLCHDIGEKLGCGGCMEHLVRTRVGIFRETDASRFARIEEFASQGREKELVIPIDRVFSKYPSLSTRYTGDKLAHNGNSIPVNQVSNVLADGLLGGDVPDDRSLQMDIPFSGTVRLYDSGGIFIGIYLVDSEKNILVPKHIFYDPAELIAQPGPYERYVEPE